MSNESVVTSKGQVTIPAKIRKKFNLLSGKKVVFIESDDGILIKPLIHNLQSLRGILQTSANPKELQDAVSKQRTWHFKDE